MIDAFEKDEHSQQEVAKKSTDQGVQWIITWKIRTKHPKRFQVGQKNSVQGVNEPLSEMLENPENLFLKLNFILALIFHIGPYGGLINLYVFT